MTKALKDREQARLAGKRAGGEKRGNSADRRARANYLVRTFGDGLTCPCVFCGGVLDAKSVTADRIIPGVLGGSYRRPNLVPACFRHNAARPDVPLTPFK